MLLEYTNKVINNFPLEHSKRSTGEKFGNITIFYVFEVSCAHQACIYLIKNTEKNCNSVKYYYNLK